MALEVEGINPVPSGWLPFSVTIVARWQVTCGFCRTRFERLVWEAPWGSRLSRAVCPACETHNLLPHHPAVRAKRR